MAVITLLSTKCSPGVSTATAALTYAWPHPVVLADCDPSGGDIVTGWLGQWLVDGRIAVDRGVLSHATATRHMTSGDPGELKPHLQPVPVAPHARVLRGLDGPAQHTALSEASWQRLARALREMSDSAGVDVLVDAGRFGVWTPRPLLAAADLTLLGMRPLARHVLASGRVLTELSRQVEPGRLGLAVLATTTDGSRDVCRAIGCPVGLELPEDVRTALVFSDGANAGEPARRSLLTRAAAAAAERLHQALNLRQPPPPRERIHPPATVRASAETGGR